MFKWPIVNKEMEDGVLEVLRAGNMSGTDITAKFERQFADWHGRKYGIGTSSGTAAIHLALFGAGIGRGDEVICPTITYWASCIQLYSLGATVVFTDVDPETLCIDPDDIEHRITEKTKAIIVVHYCGYPADMDKIMPIAKKHNLKVIEDVSHAHGTLYKGKMTGTFGDVAGFSLMSGKSFAIGEAGILITDDDLIRQRAEAFGLYEREADLTLPEIAAGKGLPWGGYKYRMHQMSSVVGVAQMKKYPTEMAEIDKAMNYFWDALEGTPGIKGIRPAKDSGSTMGGWYACLGHYKKEELGGLSATRFCEALTAEGVDTIPGCNKALNPHPIFNTIDVYNDGKPTRIAFSDRDLRQPEGSFPIAEEIQFKVFRAPWFKHFRPEVIDQYVAAFKKVAANYNDLLAGDEGDDEEGGGWGLTFRKKKEKK
jgi:dTDP-4-amino-4,6-dideoxygalactose transaminase